MAARLRIDPNLLEMPEFSGEDFDAVRQALIDSRKLTNKDATEHTDTSWVNANNRKKILWQQQQEANQEEEEARRAEDEEGERQRLSRLREEEAEERKEREKRI